MTENTTTPSYPVKLLSRTLPSARTNRLRMSWFVVGTAFGIGCASSLSPIPEQPAYIIAAPKAHQHVEQQFAVFAKPKELEEIINAVPYTVASATESPRPAQKSLPLVLDLKLGKGETLEGMLVKAGIAKEDADRVQTTVAKLYDTKDLDAGQNAALRLDKNMDNEGSPTINSMTLPVSLTSTIEIARNNAGELVAEKIDKPVERRLARAGGTITSSLYQTGTETGIPTSMISELINAYSYDVDFQREVKRGDSLDVLFERMETDTGVVAGYGNVVYAQLELGNRSIRIYRYTDKDGNSDYYSANGESVRKALLRTPVNGARISSGFGMRTHPIMGYSKMHRGVDFAAPTGTPVYAAGDGTVEFVGRKGGYGNYLKLQHNDKYASAYAHLSRFASGVAPGKKVKQGQIIAYVGNTGMSTGPHLHYEILVNNEQVNPANVKFKNGNTLAGKELASFKRNMERVEASLQAMPRGKTSIALAEFDKRTSASN